jgi:pyruvate/2-oxoglutarate dehydrogenase complex dihydrolipoamide dehydrogenase (E3) component
MHFEGGWEKAYARDIREATTKPVLLVGRVTTPDVAESLLEAGDGDAICLARQLFADPEWAVKAEEGREDDIRRCVAANLCWRNASSGQRVQCVYNPTVGREGKWGAGSVIRVADPKSILVVGGGPSGLEYARIAAARGHKVTVLEAEAETGGHIRVQSKMPDRGEFSSAWTWLDGQARKNGAEVRTGVCVTDENIDALVAELKPEHVVIATGSRNCNDGFQGWTAAPLDGHATGNCVGWDDIMTGKAEAKGEVVIIDDISNAWAPLTAVKLRQASTEKVTIVTRWPMVGMETMNDVYHDWIMPKVFEAGVNLMPNHFVREIRGDTIDVFNVQYGEHKASLRADTIIMVTGRQSVNDLTDKFAARNLPVETIGDATAPRGTYEAVFEGHRAARRI